MTLMAIDWVGLLADPWLWGLLGFGCVAFTAAGLLAVGPRNRKDRK